MSNEIYNTASLSFEYGSRKGFVSSNIAFTTLQDSITVSKSSLGNIYFQNTEIPFIISISNNNQEEIKNLVIEDDLGTYSLGQGLLDSEFTPLEFVDTAFLYIGGIFNSNITPKISKGKIVFKVSSIPAKSNIIILYKVSTNEFSPLTTGSEIKTTATVTSTCMSSPILASNTIKVKEEADIKIIKNMCPNPITSGDIITYTFSLYNYGNITATNVVLNDTFSPVAENLNVYLDSKIVPNSNYSYVGGTLKLPCENSETSISIPAANFIQDSITGIISVNPGTINITITGRIW